MTRVGIYARVSTGGQTVENQLRELRQVAERAGWQVVEEFVDQGISGAKGRDKRPAFDRLHRAIVAREIDMVMSWSVDRLGRSLQDLVRLLGEIEAMGCNLYLHQQRLDTSTPAGKALFQMMGVFAEFERAIILERIRAGLERAKAQGKRPGRQKVKPDVDAQVRARLAQGKGKLKIARELGIGTSAVQRIAKEMEAQAG